jgi:hypothetical protein
LARLSGRAGEGEPSFAAGAGLALLDARRRCDPPFAGALGQRLALTSAAAGARLLRLRADEAALRDLRLADSDDPSPAARLLRLMTGSRLPLRRGLRLACRGRPRSDHDAPRAGCSIAFSRLAPSANSPGGQIFRLYGLGMTPWRGGRARKGDFDRELADLPPEFRRRGGG